MVATSSQLHGVAFSIDHRSGTFAKEMKFKIREQFWYKLLPYLLVNPTVKISLLGRPVPPGSKALPQSDL